MIKKIVIAVLFFAALGLHAQNGTVSPYSYFGIGELRANGTVENQAMGGLSMYTDSIHVNLRNPAAYGKLALTTYTFGVSHTQIKLNSATESESSSVTNLEYLSIGFPIAKKVGVGFGLRPFSSVGYNLVSELTNADGDLVTNRFAGEGGINTVYLSLGAEVFKDLTIGVTGNLNFGTLDNRREQTLENVQFGTLDLRTSRVNGVDFNFAANYAPKIKDKYTLFTSVLINTQANLVSENAQEIGSFSVASGAGVELVDVNLEAQGLKNTELKIPTTTTLGLGFGEDKKWFLGAEYSFQGLSDFENTFLNLNNLEYTDANTIAFGGYFIPDYSSFSKYFKRVNYRAGVRYSKTGMVVNGQDINNLGITFGVGLPLGSSFSNLNIGFEVGKRGTTDANLIEENYFKVNVGLSLNDQWFIKRKIN